MGRREVVEIWNKLLRKPTQMMTEHERIVRAVNVLLIEIETCTDWLYNLSWPFPASERLRDANERQQSWARLREVAAAVATMGAFSVAEHVVEIAEIVERAPLPTLEGVDRDLRR